MVFNVYVNRLYCPSDRLIWVNGWCTS